MKIRFNNIALLITLCAVLLVSNAATAASASNAQKIIATITTYLLGDDKLESGKFIDACVSNLAYKTSSGLVGRTNDACEFEYREGDSIEFFIGGQSLGTTQAEQFVVAYDMANFGQSAAFLQSIDADGIPHNGIQVGTLVDAAIESLNYTIADVDPDDAGFRAEFRALTGREFVADIEKSVQHSIVAPRAEWIKQLALRDYYLGDANLIGCSPSQPCYNDFLLGNQQGSSFKRLQHYFWAYQVAPLMFFQERAMVGDSLNTLEKKRVAEEKAAFVADVFAAGMAVGASPDDVAKGLAKGAVGKSKGMAFDASDEYIREFLVDNGKLWSAGAFEGVLAGGRVFVACVDKRDISKASAGPCFTEFSEQVYQVFLNGFAAWALHQNQEKINAYSAALNYLTAWYNSGGKFQFIQTQSAYGFASNNQELKDYFTDGLDFDQSVFNDTVAEGLALVSKKVGEMRATGLLDVNAEDNLGLIDIKVTESFTVPISPNYFAFCYEIENLSHDTVSLGNGQIVVATQGGGTAFSMPISTDSSRPNGNLILATLGDKYQDCHYESLANHTGSTIFVATIFTEYERTGNTYAQNTGAASYQQSFEVGINEELELSDVVNQVYLAKKNQTVEPGTSVDLAAVFEVETIGTTYQWRIVSPSNIELVTPTAKDASFIAPEIPLGENNRFVRGIFTATSPAGEKTIRTFSVNVVSEDARLPQPPNAFTSTVDATSQTIHYQWQPVFVNAQSSYALYVSEHRDLRDASKYTTTSTQFSINVDAGKTYYASVAEKLGSRESAKSQTLRSFMPQPPGLGSYQLAAQVQIPSPTALLVEGDYAYVLGRDDNVSPSSGLYVVDIAKQQPEVVGVYRGFVGFPFTYENGFIYGSSGYSLNIIDVRDPTNPVESSSLSPVGYSTTAIGIEKIADRLFIQHRGCTSINACQGRYAEINVANPSQPTFTREVGGYDGSFPQNTVWTDDESIAISSFGDFFITDFANPSSIGNFKQYNYLPPNNLPSNSIEFYNSFSYQNGRFVSLLEQGFNGVDRHLLVLSNRDDNEASNTNSGFARGKGFLDIGLIRSFQLDQNILYVNTQAGAFYAYDVNTLASPALLGEIPNLGRFSRITVRGNSVFGLGENSLKILK